MIVLILFFPLFFIILKILFFHLNLGRLSRIIHSNIAENGKIQFSQEKMVPTGPMKRKQRDNI